MKRLISILLTAVMLLTMIPVFGSAADKPSTDDVFAAIDASLAVASALRGTMTDARKTQIAKAAVEQLGYETEARGDGCFVFDVDGEPCIFNCRMYNILSEMKPLDGYVDDGEVVTVDYSTRANGPSDNAKDVVLIEPFYGTDSSFTKQYQNEASSIAKATGGTYTLYKTSAATIDAVADGIENAAVVIFDSHGDTDYYETPDRGDYVSEANTSYLLLATGSGLTSADKSRGTGEYGTYYHAYSSSGYYYVDGTAITNHMEKAAPNNFVWMAICLGMATDGLEKPFRDHGVGVVYGYSQSVTFNGDYDYEETFWTNMKNGSDVKTAINSMKTRHGYWDPAMGCNTITSARREYAAFPIVVSDLDTYPGHGNVDDYQTVNSDWELFGSAVSYKVTAVSSDEKKGTVLLSGTTITAKPAEGYYVNGYTVSPKGACDVLQNGDTFMVSNIKSDCTVTISFAQKQRAVVSYAVPDGVTCEQREGYVGDIVKLEAPQGTPTADRYDYRFIGWSDMPVEDTAAKPTFYAPGAELTLSGNQTLYALYTYYKTNGDGSFTKLQAAKEDYSGDYVISYNGEFFLDASGDLTGTAIGGKKAVIPMADTEMELAEDCLYVVDNTLVYQVELYDVAANTYTVKMKNSDDYLYHTLTSNSLSTTNSPSNAGAQWKLSFTDGTAKLRNASTGKYLQYNLASTIFRCYSAGAQQELTLFFGGSGMSYFTTELKNSCEHSWDEGTVTVEPGCEKTGIKVFTCALCGEKRTETIPVLGHEFTEQVIVPTCKEGGYSSYTCSRCGYSYKDNFVKELGHDFIDGICTHCGEEDPNYVPPVPADPCDGYEDIDRTAWYHAAADYVIEKELMGSTHSDILTFEPNTKVSRAMVASILYRIAGDGEPADYSGTFTDVPEDAWYTTAVEWCSANGLASGKGNGVFDPDGLVTRQELAMFFYKLAVYQNRDVSTIPDFSDYPDADDVPAWAATAFAWCIKAGVLSGKQIDDTICLKPTDTAIRCELASILMRYLQ